MATVSKALLAEAHFLTGLLLMGVACGLDMLQSSGLDYSLAAIGTVTTFSALWWTAGLAKLQVPGYKLYRPPLAVTLFAAFSAWSLIPCILSPVDNPKDALVNLFRAAMPGITVLAAYNSERNLSLHRMHTIAFWLLGLFLLFLYTRLYSAANLLTDDASVGGAYYLLYLLPLLFVTPSHWLKALAFVTVMLVVTSSFKRAGLIGLAAGLVAYLAAHLLTLPRIGLKGLLLVAAAIALAGFAMTWLISQGDGALLERFQNLSSDHGSGRELVWALTSGMIERSDGFSLMAGHGINAVVADSPIQLSAHNDFLEVTYDYGVVGLVLYLLAIARLGYDTVRGVARKSPYAPVLAMLLTIWLIMSLVSHIIIYYWGNIVAFTIGHLLGRMQDKPAPQPTEP